MKSVSIAILTVISFAFLASAYTKQSKVLKESKGFKCSLKSRKTSKKSKRSKTLDISKAPIGMTECFTGIGGLGVKLLDFDRYTEFFREDTSMTLAQTGTYTGVEDIKEYVKFTTSESPYFSSAESQNASAFTLKEINEDICVFSNSVITRYTMNDTIVTNTDTVDVPTHVKYYYNAVENYVSKVNIFFETGYLAYLFNSLANPGGHDFICGVMSDSCGLEVNTNGPCQKRLADLPVVTDGYYVDGNSQGCRALHAVFAAENSNHCAHISFEPMEDPFCRIKCQESKIVDSMDLFDTADISKFHEFCEDNGIDVGIGYAVVP